MAEPKDKKQQQGHVDHAAGVTTTQPAEKERPKPSREKKEGPKPGSPAHEISVMHRVTKLMGELTAGGRRRVMIYLQSVEEDNRATTVYPSPGSEPMAAPPY